MDCRPPGSFIHGIFQARILEWVVMPFFRGSFQSRDRTCFSCIAGKFFTTEPPGNPQLSCYIKKSNGLSCSLNRFFYPCMILQHATGHLEYIFSLSYAHFQMLKAFYYIKKSHLVILPLISSHKSLSTRKLSKFIVRDTSFPEF